MNMYGILSGVVPVVAVLVVYLLYEGGGTTTPTVFDWDTTTQPVEVITTDDNTFYDSDFELSWETWLEWSECTKPCGVGEQVRLKLCNITQNESLTCNEELWSDDGWVLSYEIQNQTCNTFECAVNGTWTQWGGWTNCSADCGDGVQQKERFCEGIVGDGEECPGKNKEFKMCNLKECEVVRTRIKKIVLDPNPYKEADKRPSAQAIGSSYVFLIVGLLVLIIGLDLATLKRHCSVMMNNFKKNPQRTGKKKKKSKKNKETASLLGSSAEDMSELGPAKRYDQV